MDILLLFRKMNEERLNYEKVNEETLNYAVENGIIDSSYVQVKVEMHKREKILKDHASCMWYSENEDVWYCHIPDKTKPNGRRKVKRKSKEDIEDVVYKYYAENDKAQKAKAGELCLNDLAEEFFAYKAGSVEANTIKRMYADWERFYQGSDLVKINIKRMTPIDVDNFFCNIAENYHLKAKAFYNMAGILKQMFDYAKDKGYVTGSPYRVKINKNKLIPDPKKPACVEVYQSGEKERLIEEMERRFQNNPSNTAPLAIILDFELGVRKGELLALHEDDIVGNEIHVHRQVVEKIDASDCANIKSLGFGVVERTKTKSGDRWLPLTEKAKDTIRRIRETNMKYGEYYEGFLFVRNGYIMSPDMIDAQILAGCKQIGIRVKTMHKIRKTYGSTLLHGGVNLSIVSAMLGHANEATTLRSYIFNTMNAFETDNAVIAVLEKERTMTGDSEKGTRTVKKVTKSDQKIIPFSSKRKAETPGKSRISALK